MEKKRRRFRSREQWLDVLSRQVDSGLSQKAFCEREGITPSAFYQAKSRFRSMDSVVAVEEPAFVGVSVEPMEEPAHWDVELCLSEGVVLRVRRSR